MQFGRADSFLFVSRISGPKHNLLQVKLSPGPSTGLVCEELPPLGKGAYARLGREVISAAVLEGIAMANAAYGTSLCPIHIRYVADDSGPESVYGVLAEALIAEVASGRLDLQKGPFPTHSGPFGAASNWQQQQGDPHLHVVQTVPEHLSGITVIRTLLVTTLASAFPERHGTGSRREPRRNTNPAP